MALFLAAIAGFLFPILGLLQLIFFFGGMLLLFVGSVKYRCPVCDWMPTEGDGLDFNPKSCGHCRAVLRWPQ
jgi:hypothetical protein